MSAKFYAEDLGISMDRANRLAWFMELPKLKAVVSKRPWAKHGKCRVYIELWSQNKLSPIEFVKDCYYDADEDDVFLSFSAYHNYWTIKLSELGRQSFSGAKTRSAMQEFREVFYEQKANRD